MKRATGYGRSLAVALEHQRAGRLDDAAELYRAVLAVAPGHAEAHHRLGVLEYQRGRLEEALAQADRAIALAPSVALYQNSRGTYLMDRDRLDEAIACYRRALELDPGLVEAYYNLGVACYSQGRLDEAEAWYERMLDVRPDHLPALVNLGAVFKERGEHGRAIACWRRALRVAPDSTICYDNLLYTLHFCADYGPEAVWEAHREWSLLHGEPLGRFALAHANDRSPDRRLRVGYVSPDFREHAVGRFLLPLLESHDHGQVEVYCYASVLMPDATTERFRAAADHWRDVRGHCDEQLAGLVREDRIDILVDLTMHMAGSRLLAFARKPAPVQVTYLAYCGTTGLRTIDYRLTDPQLDPPGATDDCYSEQSVHLPETYWCYRAPQPAPEVGPLPAAATGRATFGCLNNFCKVTESALAAWAEVIAAVAGSRLILHACKGSHRSRVRGLFARRGVSADRLEFVEHLPMQEYLGVYGRVDVALDPFPFGGGTTTCDALWMGVPVVSLAGRTAVGRAGASILSNLGLEEFVARDVPHYIRVAAAAASDPAALSALRVGLRQRMRRSPLMDERGFARGVEAAYRGMWRRWCAGP